MKFSRDEHKEFLEFELKFQTEKYLKKINNKALYLFEKNEIYSTQFVRFKNGEMILKFKSERGIPRKGEYFTALLLKDEKRSFKTWGNLSWADLRKNYQIEFTEAVAIWQTKTDDSHYTLVGFRGINMSFANKLVEKCIVILGPKQPPYAYIQNLISLIENKKEDKILDSGNGSNCNPIGLDNTDAKDTILSKLELSNEVVVQGPPGTGKTYLISELVALLLSQNKSVLVTALTNRALLELASKEPLRPFLKKGVVYKSNLRVDEQKEVSDLKDTDDIVMKSGSLMLATFYISSGIALNLSQNKLYDYVIMDEASQALLAMFSATTMLAQKRIWIGDPFQLPPIVELNDKYIKKKNWKLLIEGMTNVCNNNLFPFYQLTNSYRLTERAVKYTGIFYDNKLKSCSHLLEKEILYKSDSSTQKFLHKNGGPSLIKTSLIIGSYCPDSAVNIIIKLVKELQILYGSKLNIAIITKFRRSVEIIQKNVISSIVKNKHIIIDTVERVQGLTTDVTIFFIPNKYMGMSLEKSFFNVATSRSLGHTIIIADKTILDLDDIEIDIKDYIDKLDKDFSLLSRDLD